jgi:FKBP-type peptidyl-prolyl cis-trans isomerase (trigger factor)
LNNFARDLQRQGMDLNNVGSDFIESIYPQMQSQAERDVRGALLLEKIAELENVDVPDEELNEELGKMAEYYRMGADEIRDMLSKQQNGLANIKNNLRTRKTVEALVGKATVAEGEWVEETPEQPAAETESAPEAEEKPKKTTKAKAKTTKKSEESGEAEKPKATKKKSAKSES